MNSHMLTCLVIFTGGGIGAVSRYLLGLQAVKLWGTDFPFGTLTINVVGSFLIGVIASYFMLYSNSSNQDIRLFLIVGVLGGFTTFSSFSLETMMLWQKGAVISALVYVMLSVLLSLMAVLLGSLVIKMAR